MQKVHLQKIFARGDELVAIGLDLPFAMKMSQSFDESNGIELNSEHMSEEELVNDVWTSNFNK